ncbi:MAG: pyrroline-5-carboxylate reductase [Kineosporiaceae bacterium]
MTAAGAGTVAGVDGARPTVAVVGAGAMGGALLTGLARAGWGPGELLVVEPDAARRAAVTAATGSLPGDVPAAAAADVVVVAVKPAQVAGVLAELSGHLGSRRPVVVSIAAGVTLAALERALPAGVPVVRVMPNTPALIGEGTSALSGGSRAEDRHLTLAERVMAAVGTAVRVPESLQGAVTALSGSGPAYLFYLVDAMVEGGVLLGLDRATARELAVRTVLGSSRLLAETGRHPVELREQVTSPAGTTVEALRVLDDAGVRAAVLRAMRAARDRSREMSGG